MLLSPSSPPPRLPRRAGAGGFDAVVGQKGRRPLTVPRPNSYAEDRRPLRGGTRSVIIPGVSNSVRFEKRERERENEGSFQSL